MTGEPHIVEMALLLLLAFVLGGLCGFWVQHWLEPKKDGDTETEPPPSEKSESAAVGTDGNKPPLLKKARNDAADDLKKINGIGPKIEKLLNGLGVFHYDQIAAWDQGAIAWVDENLSFHGRIEREDWVGQAKGLVGNKK
jgi:NADH-quinone oxidoreductase subunit E